MKSKTAKITSLFAVLLMPLMASADPILDQEHFVSDPNASGSLSNGTSFGRSQTVTVGLAGLFDSIDVEVVGNATQARLLATAGGIPIGGSGGSVVLATSSAVSSVGNIFTFDFSAAGLMVGVGDILAIELFGNGSWRGAFVASGGSYAGGSDYFFNTGAGFNNWSINQGFDWNFRTYVDADVVGVPEPGTLALLSVALFGMAMARRRKV